MAPSFPKDDILNWASNLANTTKANSALHNALDAIRTKGPEALAATKNDPTLTHALSTLRTKSSDVLAAIKDDPNLYNAMDTLRTRGSDVLAAAKSDPTITNALATLRTRTPQYLAAVTQNRQFQSAVEAMRRHGPDALAYLQRPEVQRVLIAGGLAAGGTALIVHLAGFGLVGIAAGSPAAAFQSAMYKGLTPGGSIFSGLTAMGMTGGMAPLLLGTAVGVGILAAVGTAAFELERSKL